MANKWVLFLKKYAKETNQSYACALSDPRASQEYKKLNGQSSMSDIQTKYNEYKLKTKNQKKVRYEKAQKKVEELLATGMSKEEVEAKMKLFYKREEAHYKKNQQVYEKYLQDLQTVHGK